MSGQVSARAGVDRVVTFDVLRGLAIGGMVFLHNGAFHLASLAEALKSPPWWLVAFGFLLLWAGLFGVVSGAANATATLRRLQRASLAPGQPWRYPSSLMSGALQTFAILFVLHWVWTLAVGNSAVTKDPGDPTLRVTMLLGLIYYGFVPRIHPQNWVFASALWMIGSNVLLSSLALRWFYRRQPPHEHDGLSRYLLLLAACVLLATPVLRALLYAPMMYLVEQGGVAIAAAVPLALLVNDPNPVFPFFAYGLMGAVAGVSLVRNEPRVPLYRSLGWSGVVLVLLGGVGLGALGGVVLADREGIWGHGPIYFTSLSYVLLGLFAWLLIGLLALLDPGPASARAPWRPRALGPMLRFGRSSLTIFLLEGVVGMLLRVLLDALAPGWNVPLGNVLAFGLGNVLLWYVILVLWERVDYRYSMEWWLARIRASDARARVLT
jgi:hypothetical protein